MEEKREDGLDSTNEKFYTEGGWEASEMIHPKTKEKLIIRECFTRRQLIDDGETEAEFKMRKRLLNAFKKNSKRRGILIPPSVYKLYLEAEKNKK